MTLKEDSTVCVCVCVCVCARVCLCVHFASHYLLPEGLGRRFYARNVKLTKLVLLIGCSSHYLTSRWKLGLIQNLLVQILNAFYQNGIAKETKII